MSEFTSEERRMAMQMALVALMKRHRMQRLILSRDEFVTACNGLDMSSTEDGAQVIVELEDCDH